MSPGAASLSLDSVALPGSPSLESHASASTATAASGAVVCGPVADSVLETRGPAPCEPAERACWNVRVLCRSYCSGMYHGPRLPFFEEEALLIHGRSQSLGMLCRPMSGRATRTGVLPNCACGHLHLYKNWKNCVPLHNCLLSFRCLQ